MVDHSLPGRRVLVVEDEYLIADALSMALERAGAIVVGPTASVSTALALIDAQGTPDVALLDINLEDSSAFPLADRLAERGCPVYFMTGYDSNSIPPRYSAIPRFEKPVDAFIVTRIIAMAVSK